MVTKTSRTKAYWHWFSQLAFRIALWIVKCFLIRMEYFPFVLSLSFSAIVLSHTLYHFLFLFTLAILRLLSAWHDGVFVQCAFLRALLYKTIPVNLYHLAKGRLHFPTTITKSRSGKTYQRTSYMEQMCQFPRDDNICNDCKHHLCRQLSCVFKRARPHPTYCNLNDLTRDKYGNGVKGNDFNVKQGHFENIYFALITAASVSNFISVRMHNSSLNYNYVFQFLFVNSLIWAISANINWRLRFNTHTLNIS